jgi:hypothetical protein
MNHLYENVKHLLDNEDLCNQLGSNAYKTLQSTWNEKEAATRLIKLCQNLLDGNEYYFEKGPCSKADIVKQKYNY